jgi:hypothetical protein
MFDVYGEQNLFTLHSTKDHADRKKLLSHFYAKSTVLKEPTTRLIEEKAHEYMKLINSEPGGISEIFTTLHYYSLDNITAFIYGRYGSTASIKGSQRDRALIQDIVHPSRRRLSWFWVHFPKLTKWLYTRRGWLGQLVKAILPMQKPTTYTGIRSFAYNSVQKFAADYESGQQDELDGECAP